jgi:trk system potassium uptake protein TrkH
MLLLAKVGSRELFQLSHPRAVTVIKLGGKAVPDNVLFSIWGFYVLYIITSLVLTVAMMAAGLDLESAFGAVMATLNLLGPGLGEVATNFSTVTPVVKWLSTFAMLVGRLEVFTLLILLYPPFWKR